jgi:signal transduction histidine kinase
MLRRARWLSLTSTVTSLPRTFAKPETYRVLVYLLTGIPLGTLWVTLLVTGWGLALGVAITPLVVPVLIGIGAMTRLAASAERALAKKLLGVDVGRPEPPPRSQGYWGRGFAVLTDRRVWRAQAYLLLRLVLALPVLAPLSWALQLLAAPVTYRWDSPDLGILHPDTFGEALLLVPPGLVLLAVALLLVRPLGALSRRLARRWLAGGGTAASPAAVSAARRQRLAIHAAATVCVSALLTLIWALTPHGSFWLVWPLLSLGLLFAIHWWVVLVLERPAVRRRAAGSLALGLHAGVSAALAAFLVGVWAATAQDYFWPVWPVAALAAVLAAHAFAVLYRREHRIEVLETSRAGAVNVQETELRRIERDLHDGAQARLVALGMSLGMAEQKLESDPDAVRELLREARRGASEALAELRDLARGIRPPILTDRGLEAAVTALTARSPVAVTLSIDVRERPPDAVETAAYFVVAEAVANATKHAGAAHLDIRIESALGVLVAEIVDDGDGGAEASGGGLTGLRQRVEALDGNLCVTSPRGGPTTIRAELPCAS